ncbi:MAG TPA: efflux RND transporter periplasmic adaptor subunit, partial [Candidatus Limnocylindrales bacterium]
MRLKLLAIAVLLVGAGVAVAWSTGLIAPSQAATSTYLTAAATVRDVSSDIAATGTVAASQSWDLSFGSAAQVATSASSSSSSNGASGGSSVTWPVTAVKATVGQAVKKGDELATAATTDLDSQIIAARRQKASASYQLQLAQTNRDNASGDTAIQNADIQLLQAQSSYDGATASYEALAAEKPHASLVAPADGIVTAVNVVEGQDAPSGVAITVASNTLQVTTSVVESDVPLITVGQDASVTLTAVNATLQGSVATIAPTGSSSGSNGSVSFAVTILLKDVPSGVRPGMSASVTITTAAATNVLAVPSRALTG